MARILSRSLAEREMRVGWGGKGMENCIKCKAKYDLSVQLRPISIKEVNRLVTIYTYVCSCGYGFKILKVKIYSGEEE